MDIVLFQWMIIIAQNFNIVHPYMRQTTPRINNIVYYKNRIKFNSCLFSFYSPHFCNIGTKLNTHARTHTHTGIYYECSNLCLKNKRNLIISDFIFLIIKTLNYWLSQNLLFRYDSLLSSC